MSIRSARPDRPARATCALHEMPLRRWALVREVLSRGATVGAERARQLVEIGFRPGERVRLVARAWPGGEPMVACIGGTRFALRRAEAECVRVEPCAEKGA